VALWHANLDAVVYVSFRYSLYDECFCPGLHCVTIICSRHSKQAVEESLRVAYTRTMCGLPVAKTAWAPPAEAQRNTTATTDATSRGADIVATKKRYSAGIGPIRTKGSNKGFQLMISKKLCAD
jgi:hypothetical protein